jgi:putative membrane protein
MMPPPAPTLPARALLGLALAWTLPALPAVAADTPHTLDRQEQAFVAKATADNSMQIELAKVALDRSSSAQVHALAKRIIDDHEALNRKFTDFSVAKKAHGRAHGTPAEDVTRDKLQLQRLHGDALDQAFAGMMVTEHQKIIPLYEQAARDAHDPSLRGIARDGLPMLRDHLQKAHAITAR